MQESTLVILAHGFCRRAEHLQFWRDSLADQYADIICADMPATHRSFECCLEVLTRTITEAQPERYDNLYLAGHSMGGLLLREYLNLHRPANARRLVCVGTPHYGSKLADIALLMPGAGWIWPPLKALKSSVRKKLTSPDIPGMKIGLIVGTNNAHWPGKLFLSDSADGLVESFSAHAPDGDSVVYTDVPHDPMQYDEKIAWLIKKFFNDGAF